MKVRTALLAMLLLDLAAGATWFAGRYGHGQPDALRLFLVWALPGLVFVCGLLTREPKRTARASSASALPGRLRLPGIPLPALPPARPSLPLPSPAIAGHFAGDSAGEPVAVAPAQPSLPLPPSPRPGPRSATGLKRRHSLSHLFGEFLEH